MKRLLYLCIIPMLSLVLLSGCSKEAETAVSGGPKPVTIKVGHVGHDHHIALFVALDNADKFSKTSGIELRTIEDRQRYELIVKNRKIADVQIVMVGGGAKMPTALAQEVIDIGFGGSAPTLASIDKGSPVKLIAPLHYKGDMFTLRPDFPAKSWKEFVAYAKTASKPVRIGYKAPNAVAKIIFEEALRHEGVSFGSDLSQASTMVHMVNTKGGGKLNTALSGGLIDGYAGNNPFPAIGLEKGILKIVCDLEELPPGTFRNHPCCCIAANSAVLNEKKEAIIALLTLFIQATDLINSDLDTAVASATRWIGTSEQVERNSIPTSGYSMTPSKEWHASMATWFDAMNRLGVFTDKLKELKEDQAAAVAYDLSLLSKAEQQLGK